MLAFVLFIKSWRKRTQQASEYETVSQRVRFLICQRLVRIKIPYKCTFHRLSVIWRVWGFWLFLPQSPPVILALLLAVRSSSWLWSAGERVRVRCFDTVFQRPYRYFSIALKGILSLSDRYKIFASDWLWIEVCQNVLLTKIDITMTTINQKIGNW